MQILKHTSPKELHLIDPWTFQPEFPQRKFGGKKARRQEDMDKIFHHVSRRLGSLPNVSIHRKTSQEALAGFEDASLDWIYIDGNHAFEFVLEDLRLGFAKVRPGGYVTGDDYTWGRKCGHPVEKAVDQFLLEESLEEQMGVIGSQYIILKPA